MSKIENPHDQVFKKTFGRLDVASGYLRHNLPPELVADIDLDSLQLVSGSFVDKKLMSYYSDLLYTVDLLKNPFQEGISWNVF